MKNTRLDEPGEPEVGDLDNIVLSHQHVPRGKVSARIINYMYRIVSSLKRTLKLRMTSLYLQVIFPFSHFFLEHISG